MGFLHHHGADNAHLPPQINRAKAALISSSKLSWNAASQVSRPCLPRKFDGQTQRNNSKATSKANYK